MKSNPKCQIIWMATLVSIGMAFSSPSLAWGKEDGSSPMNLANLIEDESVVTLSLTDVVVQALKHNLDITVSRQTRDVRVTDILFEQAKFDPTVELSGRYDRSIVPLNRPVFGFGGVSQGSDPDNFDQNDTQVSLAFFEQWRGMFQHGPWKFF